MQEFTGVVATYIEPGSEGEGLAIVLGGHGPKVSKSDARAVGPPHSPLRASDGDRNHRNAGARQDASGSPGSEDRFGQVPGVPRG